MSTLVTTNIQTANGTTDLTIKTGNTSGAAIIVAANGSGFVLQSNSTSNVMTVNSSAVSYLGTQAINAIGVTVGSNISINTSTIFVGNSTVNVSVNSTSFSGTANNANYLGGTAASGYQTTSGLSTTVATLTANNANYLGSNGVYGNTSGLYSNGDIVLLTNNKQLKFATVNSSSYAYFIQQNDDNFVFYTTNTAYGTRAVYSIYANSITSSLNFAVTSNFANIATTGSSYVSNGFYVVAGNWGVISANITLNSANGNYQYFTSNAAYTITAPTQDCAIDILVTNGTGASTITFSGFTVQSGGTGDTYATTASNKYILSVRRINSVSTYVWKALQ